MQKGVLNKQLTISVPNRLGTLAEITGLIASYKINLIAICAYTVNTKCVMSFVSENNNHAKRVLKEKGYKVEEDEVVLVTVLNRPGALQQISERLSAAGVDLRLIYGSVEKFGKTSRIVMVSKDTKEILAALKSK